MTAMGISGQLAKEYRQQRYQIKKKRENRRKEKKGKESDKKSEYP